MKRVADPSRVGNWDRYRLPVRYARLEPKPEGMGRIHPLPRTSVEANYAAGRICAICGQAALSVVHLVRLPDYVRCSSCASAYVLGEGSSLVMYGSISASYPATREFALKQWIALPAIQVRAEAERGAVEEPTPPFGIGSAAAQNNGAAERAATPPFGIGTLNEFLGQEPGALIPETAETAGDAELGHESAEPDPGQWFKVMVSAQPPNFPADLCAHCLRQPADRGLVVIGADPNQTRYPIPLCRQCHQRVTARSGEEKNSRLAVHLGSIAIGMILIVSLLAVDVLDVRQAPLASILVLGALGLIGYTLPAWLLLGRLSRLPPAADASYVRSTLQVRAGLNGEPTGYLWRNRGYADRFAAANDTVEVARIGESNGLEQPA